MKTHIIIFASVFLAVVPSNLRGQGTFSPASDVNTPKFIAADPIPAGTAAHSAVALPNGDILVTGGYNKLFDKIPIASNLARIFDHKTQKWRIAKGQLNFGRLNHASIVIPASDKSANAKVLIAGGISQAKEHLTSIELFDLKTEQFTILPAMATARKSPHLNLLPNGSILITGQTKKAEILRPDPSTPGGFTIGLTRHGSHANHTDHATVSMPDGPVVLIGGRTNMIERFDPKTERFTRCKTRLPNIYDDQAAVLLYDNTILLVGGQEVYTNKCTNKTWIFNPKTDTLTNGPALGPQQNCTTFIGLSDLMAVDLFQNDKNRKGKYILLCGGEDDPGKGKKPKPPDVILDTAWVYHAATQTFRPVGPMITPHDDFAAAVLPIKNNYAGALIIAGYNANDNFQANCEIFQWPVLSSP